MSLVFINPLAHPGPPTPSTTTSCVANETRTSASDRPALRDES